MWSTYLIVAEGDVGGEVGDRGAREVGPGGEVGGEVGDMGGGRKVVTWGVRLVTWGGR